MKNLSLIVAIGKNNELGYNNQLLWQLPNDLKYFKARTLNKTIVMGRKTFESLPTVLANRNHVILTNNKNYQKEGLKIFNNKEEVLNYLKGIKEESFIIGGSQIYREFFPYCQTIYITEIEKDYPQADCYFPNFDKSKYFKTIIKTEIDKGLKYSFVKYEKLT